MKAPIKVFFRTTPQKLTQVKNFDPRKDPCKNFDTRKNIFHLRNPRKKNNARKKYFNPRNPRNPRNNLTHATHTPMHPRNPRTNITNVTT